MSLHHPADLGSSSGGYTTHQNLGGVGAVDGNGIDEQLQGLGIDGTGVRDLLVVDIADVGLHNCHAIGGQRARLVRADGGGIAHGLTGIQVAYQIVVFHHFLGAGAGERATVRRGSWGGAGSGVGDTGKACSKRCRAAAMCPVFPTCAKMWNWRSVYVQPFN